MGAVQARRRRLTARPAPWDKKSRHPFPGKSPWLTVISNAA